MKIELSEREIEILRRALREDVVGNLESKIKMNENAELYIKLSTGGVEWWEVKYNGERRLIVINNMTDTIQFEMTGRLSIVEDGN